MKKHPKIRSFLCSVLFIALFFQGRCSHILGGNLSFQVLEQTNITNHFQIKFDLYKDCSALGVPSTNSTSFSIYRENNGDFELIDILEVFPEAVLVEFPYYDCYDLPDYYCVERSRYLFQISLDVFNGSYYIINQRCCRSLNLTNIINPEITGSTYYIEIDSVTQSTENSSPILPEFPAIACVGEELNFPFEIHDIEGDSISIELCPPLNGGGTDGGLNGGNPNGCSGIAPIPACPPPFIPITYVPLYNESIPLGEFSFFSFNLIDKRIDIKPNVAGSYLVSFRLNEYRNNETISSIQHDFELLVVECSKKVEALVACSDYDEDGNCLIYSCNSKNIEIENQSINSNSSIEPTWIINGENNTYKSTHWNVAVPLNIEEEKLEGWLYLKSDNGNCQDSSSFTIFNSNVSADFYYKTEENSFPKYEVYFQDASENIDSWRWSFPGLEMDTLCCPFFVFPDTGLFDVQLKVSNKLGCCDSTSKIVDIAPMVSLYYPSAFSPNGDNINDIFMGLGRLDLVKEYQLRVWDRWGGLLFKTDDKTEGWDGMTANGLVARTGLYFYKAEIVTWRNDRLFQKGIFHLLF